MLKVLLEDEAYSDVVREAQEAERAYSDAMTVLASIDLLDRS